MIRQTELAMILMSLLASGCGTSPPGRNNETPASWHASGFHPPAPAGRFSGYESVFEYIAEQERLPLDKQSILALAADSTLERFRYERTGRLVIVRAQSYAKHQYGIRGAQGQGRYYVFQQSENTWRLVGILHGNSYRWDNTSDRIRIISRWHYSIGEHAETAYTWNGERFEASPTTPEDHG